MNKKTLFFIFGGFIVFWLVVLCSPLNNITGFDQEDDHFIAELNREFTHGESFLSLLSIELNADDGIRYRPLWVLSRVAMAKTFGAGWVYYSIVNALIAALTSMIVFLVARRLQFPIGMAILLSIVILIGPQLQGYIWRAPQEPIAFLFACLTLLIVTSSCFSGGRSFLYLFGALLASGVSMLTKESFILLLPAFVIWRIIVLIIYKELAIIDAFKKSILWIVCFSVLFAAAIALIVNKVGIEAGYYGIESGERREVSKYLINAMFLAKTVPGIVFITGTILFSCMGKLPMAGKRNSLFIAAATTTFGFAWTIPQIVLYTKSGFDSRYYLPVVMGLWLPFFVLFNLARSYGRIVYRQMLLAFAIAAVVLSVTSFSFIVSLGNWRQSWTDVVLDIKMRANSSSKVLVIADPSEDYTYGKNMFNFLTGYLMLPEENVHVMFNPPPPYVNDTDNRTQKIQVLGPMYQGHVISGLNEIADYDLVAVPRYQANKVSFTVKFRESLQGFATSSGAKYVHFYR